MTGSNGKPTSGAWDVPDYARPPAGVTERQEMTASEVGADAAGTFMQDPQRMLDTLSQGMKQDLVNLIAWRAHALEAEEQRRARRAQQRSSAGMMDALSTAMKPDQKRKERDKIARGCAVYPIIALWAVGLFMMWRDLKWWPLIVVAGILQVGWMFWSIKAPPPQRRDRQRRR